MTAPTASNEPVTVLRPKATIRYVAAGRFATSIENPEFVKAEPKTWPTSGRGSPYVATPTKWTGAIVPIGYAYT